MSIEFERFIPTNQKTTSRVLVVFAHGIALVLACEPSVALDFAREDLPHAGEGGFVPAEGSYKPMPDGIYVGQLSLADDGPGDWPGSHEFSAVIAFFTPATAEQWSQHLAGEWPWEPS